MASWVGRGLAVLVFASLSACGDDAEPSPSSSGEDGGMRGEAARGGESGSSAGKGGKAGRGGSSAPSSGKDGGSAQGGSTAAGGPGEYDDYWKRRSVHLTVIDPTNPSGFTDETVELPDRIPNPVDGREVDLYIQIKDDQRHTYALFEGDQVYYRMITPLVKADNTYFDPGGGDLTQIYELADGVLKDTRISAVSTFSVTAESTYEKAAEFPPSDWPDQMLDAPELMP